MWSWCVSCWTVTLLLVNLSKAIRAWKEMCWHETKDLKWAVKPAGTGIDTGLCAGRLCSETQQRLSHSSKRLHILHTRTLKRHKPLFVSVTDWHLFFPHGHISHFFPEIFSERRNVKQTTDAFQNMKKNCAAGKWIIAHQSMRENVRCMLNKSKGKKLHECQL